MTDNPVSEDQSLSLDRLSKAFAQLMGDQPRVPPADREGTDESAGERSPEEPSEVEPTPVTPQGIVEAILFVGHPDNRPLTAREIASHVQGISPDEVTQIVEQLNIDYQQRQMPIQIILDGEGYRMTLRSPWDNMRERFYGRIREARLSQLAIDLLAVVAYRQPISRDQIEALRGRPCGGALRQLVRRELLSIERTADRPRQVLYRTTDRFLDLFRLDSLQDLPLPDASGQVELDE